jgi:DNA-binding LacI/PurR family transcriptional regulator
METTVLNGKQNKPLYLQLCDSLAEGFIARIDDDGKLPSVREIARNHNVSMITAIKAIDHLKEQGIVCGYQRKGLYIKDKDRLLEYYSAQPRTIGVAFLDMYNTSSTFLSTVICSLSSECSRLGLNLQIFSIPSAGMSDNRLFWKNIRKNNVDGLIIATRMPIGDIRLLQQEGIPFVWVNVGIPGEDIYSTIANKLYYMNMCLLHIKRLGHRKITVISAEEDADMQSYLDTLCPGYGLDYSFCVMEGPEKKVGYDLAKRVIETDKPDVLFTRGTELTVSALSYITEQRISLPDDLAFISHSSSSSNPFLPGNITVINTQASALAAQAVRVLNKVIEGREPVEKRTVVPAELVIRGSCGFPMRDRGEITYQK